VQDLCRCGDIATTIRSFAPQNIKFSCDFGQFPKLDSWATEAWNLYRRLAHGRKEYILAFFSMIETPNFLLWVA
jgi:hypothetical protein